MPSEDTLLVSRDEQDTWTVSVESMVYPNHCSVWVISCNIGLCSRGAGLQELRTKNKGQLMTKGSTLLALPNSWIASPGYWRYDTMKNDEIVIEKTTNLSIAMLQNFEHVLSVCFCCFVVFIYGSRLVSRHQNCRQKGYKHWSWCMVTKGEMSGTVCVTCTWYMYIYGLFIAFVCFVVCSLL